MTRHMTISRQGGLYLATTAPEAPPVEGGPSYDGSWRNVSATAPDATYDNNSIAVSAWAYDTAGWWDCTISRSTSITNPTGGHVMFWRARDVFGDAIDGAAMGELRFEWGNFPTGNAVTLAIGFASTNDPATAVSVWGAVDRSPGTEHRISAGNQGAVSYASVTTDTDDARAAIFSWTRWIGTGGTFAINVNRCNAVATDDTGFPANRGANSTANQTIGNEPWIFMSATTRADTSGTQPVRGRLLSRLLPGVP